MSKKCLALIACGLTTACLSLGAAAHAQKGSTGHQGHIRPAAVAKTAQPVTALDYTTSWIGNTYGGNDADPQHTLQHVPLDMNTVYATPDGKVYTNTPWEEGGRPVSVFKDGKLISPLDNGPNSQNWSNGGGIAVAADSQYIFRSNGPNGTGITLLDANTMAQASMSLSGSSTLNNSKGIFGLAISHGKLYATEDDLNIVDVFDLKSLSLVESFSIKDPVRIAVDKKGGMWVSHMDHTPLPNLGGNVYDINGQMGLATVDHYDNSGSLMNTITLPDNGQVGALWIDNQGQLLVGDDGPDQDIKVYGSLEHTPGLLFTLGTQGGIYADVDPHRGWGGGGENSTRGKDGKEPGEMGPWRFRGITGIATDAQNNLYVT